MATLPSATENRILLLGAGMLTLGMLGLMRHMLIIYRNSVELKKPSPKTQYITQGTEDSLKTSTLEKLVEDYNYSIQETATRIVCDRALHDDAALDALLWEVTRPDYDRREQAVRAIHMLIEQQNITELDKRKVYSALVTCLKHCIDDVPHEKYDQGWDNFEHRDTVERLCLEVLFRLAGEFGPQGIIRAGIVQNWLAWEPWGSTPKERLENFRHCYTAMKLSELILMIAHDQVGLKLLVQAKLIDTTDPEFFPQPVTTRDNVLSEISLTEGGLRPREQSVEERHLRRRHREAMVLNDGVQPIGVSDIIEREYESPVEERRQP